LPSTEAKILVIGLGQIGYSNIEYMTSLGLEVDGYDISDGAVERALDNKLIGRAASTFQGYDYYIVCVSTHNPSNMSLPSFDGLLSTVYRLSCEGKRGALVAVESTITRGVSHRIEQILEHRLHVAHVPHRFYADEKAEHGVRQTRVLGGCKSCCTRKALHLYQDMLEIPVHTVKSIQLAELSKVIENSHRFMEIAFAEELKMLCDAYSLDFSELREAVNSKWNVKILEPRKGVGGHCLPKDSQMYVDLTKQVLASSVVDSAKTVDEDYKTSLTQDQSTGVIVHPRLSNLATG
jgi:nucleotide sugar dehydrogenase